MQTITEQAKSIIEQKIKNRLASTPFVDHSYVGNMVREYVTFGLTDPELLKAQGLYSDQWIGVKERLPETDGPYLVRCTYWGLVVRVWNKYHNCWDGEDSDDHYSEPIGDKITHWMPLPDSPPTDKQP